MSFFLNRLVEPACKALENVPEHNEGPKLGSLAQSPNLLFLMHHDCQTRRLLNMYDLNREHPPVWCVILTGSIL